MGLNLFSCLYKETRLGDEAGSAETGLFQGHRRKSDEGCWPQRASSQYCREVLRQRGQVSPLQVAKHSRSTLVSQHVIFLQ